MFIWETNNKSSNEQINVESVLFKHQKPEKLKSFTRSENYTIYNLKQALFVIKLTVIDC